MGRMKELFTNIEEHLRAGEFAEALSLLEPWKDDMPNQLWATVAGISGEPVDDYLPSHYLPRSVRNKTLTLADLKRVCLDLEAQEVSAVNVALALDLIEREANA